MVADARAGMALGYLSSIIPVGLIAGAIYFCLKTSGLYGLACGSLGMLVLPHCFLPPLSFFAHSLPSASFPPSRSPCLLLPPSRPPSSLSPLGIFSPRGTTQVRLEACNVPLLFSLPLSLPLSVSVLRHALRPPSPPHSQTAAPAPSLFLFLRCYALLLFILLCCTPCSHAAA
jgi:hypothetical protein